MTLEEILEIKEQIERFNAIKELHDNDFQAYKKLDHDEWWAASEELGLYEQAMENQVKLLAALEEVVLALKKIMSYKDGPTADIARGALRELRGGKDDTL